MELKNSPRGLILDLITPFNHNGDVDGRGLGRLLDRALPHVEAVLIASPFVGEGKYLAIPQREDLLEKVLVVVRGKIPVLVWITRREEEETKETLLRLEKRVAARNYRGTIFWVDSPLYYRSNRGLMEYFRGLCLKTHCPVLLHNDPSLIKELEKPLKRNNIRTNVLKELSSLQPLKGLIFLGSLDRVNHYQKAVRGRTDFRIYDGDESRFLKYPSRSGVVSVGANLAPRAWRKITLSSLHLGDSERPPYPDQLSQIWETGDYLRTLIDHYQTMPVLLIKRILFDMGIIETPNCSFDAGDLGDAPNALEELMERQGDYEGKTG